MNFIRNLFYVKQVKYFIYSPVCVRVNVLLNNGGEFYECEEIIHDQNTHMMKIDVAWRHRITHVPVFTHSFYYDKNTFDDENVLYVKEQLKCFENNHNYHEYKKCLPKKPEKFEELEKLGTIEPPPVPNGYRGHIYF
jgi:hypothetical protein